MLQVINRRLRQIADVWVQSRQKIQAPRGCKVEEFTVRANYQQELTELVAAVTKVPYALPDIVEQVFHSDYRIMREDLVLLSLPEGTWPLSSMSIVTAHNLDLADPRGVLALVAEQPHLLVGRRLAATLPVLLDGDVWYFCISSNGVELVRRSEFTGADDWLVYCKYWEQI